MVATIRVVLARTYVSHVVASVVATKGVGVSKTVVVSIASTATARSHEVRLLAVSVTSVAVHGWVGVGRNVLIHENLVASIGPARGLGSILNWDCRWQEGILVPCLVTIVPDTSRSVETSGRHSVTYIRAAVIRDGPLPGVVSRELYLGQARQRWVYRGLCSNGLDKRSTARVVRIG